MKASYNYNKRKLGAGFEVLASEFLVSNGLIILDTNFRNRFGEIDIIANDNKTIVFIEVKYRTSSRYGNALEAVNISKQNQIKYIAKYYLYLKHIPYNTPVRFDVIGITEGKLTWIKDAF